ncbi:MAG: hypothetical protein AB8B84_00905 [Granulosicoccus sp.]
MSTQLLTKARTVTRPTREAMLQRDPSVSRFWNENKKLFEDAWTDWDNGKVISNQRDWIGERNDLRDRAEILDAYSVGIQSLTGVLKLRWQPL